MEYSNTIFNSLEIIEKRIAGKLTVSDIAYSVQYSKFHFMRLFREIAGDSVMNYITKRKLTLAGRALLETNDTVHEIAFQYGFESHEGFTRSFKSYMGITPVDYRAYGLTALQQKIFKERKTMAYSKIGNDVIRELNMFIALAKKTAEYARKAKIPLYMPFWEKMADKTDEISDKLKHVLTQITEITDRPDEITNGFTILKTIDETVFNISLLSFVINLTISRATPEYANLQKPLCERYSQLAASAKLKTKTAALFFNELSSLIVEDMKKNAAKIISEAIQAGNEAAKNITAYPYIKEEIEMIINDLSIQPIQEMTTSRLENNLSKLDIVSFAADVDMFRNPNAKIQFDGILIFRERLIESIAFFQTYVKPDDSSHAARSTQKNFDEIALHENILLFYTKGEVFEKMFPLLDEGQKDRYELICKEISDTIQYTVNSTESSEYKAIAEKLACIYDKMLVEADVLQKHGGAIRFLAFEFKKLADHIGKLAT